MPLQLSLLINLEKILFSCITRLEFQFSPNTGIVLKTVHSNGDRKTLAYGNQINAYPQATFMLINRVYWLCNSQFAAPLIQIS